MLDETAADFALSTADELNAIHLNIAVDQRAGDARRRITTTRTVTNTTGTKQTFKASTTSPAGSKISVSPTKFELKAGASKTLKVTIESDAPLGDQQFGAIKIVAKKGSASRSAGGCICPSRSSTPGRRQPRSELRARHHQARRDDRVHGRGDEPHVRRRCRRPDDQDRRPPQDPERNRRDPAGKPQGHRLRQLERGRAGRSNDRPRANSSGTCHSTPSASRRPPSVTSRSSTSTSRRSSSTASTYTQIGVDSNGYVVAGGGTREDNDCCNLPDRAGAGPAQQHAGAVLDRPRRDGAPGIFAGTLTDGVNTGSSSSGG